MVLFDSGFSSSKIITLFLKLTIPCFIFLNISNEIHCKTVFDIDSAVNRNSFYEFSVNKTLNFKQDNESFKLICFYSFTNDFKSEIMTDLCTHIIVGFFSIDTQNFSLQTSPENQKLLREVVMLKKKKRLKVIISVGGYSNNCFSPMVKNHTTRKMFIQSSMKFIKKFKIDGLDLDWEWPVLNGSTKEKIKFVQLLREIKDEFNRHKKSYTLSLDVPAIKEIIELGYYVKYISEIVDFVNIMCYDYHFYTPILPLTGYNAPLYSSKNDLLSTLNVNFSVNFWISQSMLREKIVLGVPIYGHTYKLLSPSKHDIKAPSTGYGSIGQNGFATYPEICNFIKQENASVIYDNASKVPYTYKDLEWISFDNEMSLSAKAKFAIEEKLGGIMAFSVNSDDYSGNCSSNGIILPLIRRLKHIVSNIS